MIGAVLVQAAPAAALRTPPGSACAVRRHAASRNSPPNHAGLAPRV